MIVVWFSCGAASAVAAKMTLDMYKPLGEEVRIVNNPVAEEHEDNARFLSDMEGVLGCKIEQAISPKYPSQSCVDVWDDVSFMSGKEGAPCTKFLKKQARYEWELVNKPNWHVFGFTLDEVKRHNRFTMTERENVLPILIHFRITKTDCYRLLDEWGVKRPAMYDLGYPNANCIGCVKATSPTYWNHVRKVHPTVFEERAKQSRRIGARLVRVKNERIFLDELDPKAKGRSMKNLDLACGIICEEDV